MEGNTIDNRMKVLGKKYRELERASTSVIWSELINAIDQYLSGCQSSAFETFYKLFLKNVDSLRTDTIENENCLYRMRLGKNVGTVEDERNDDTVNVPVNDTVKLSQLTEQQRKIYEIIKTGTINDTANVPINVPINTSGLATMFNVSEKTIKRDFYVLRDLNLIKYVGSNKTGHWEVRKKGM